MFETLSLRNRLFIQIAIAIIPLALMLVYRMWAESRPADAFQSAVNNYQAALSDATQYRSFLNGVSDAVDSGKLGATAIEALSDLVMHNLGYQLFRAIESCKVKLSSAREARVQFDEARIHLDVRVSRAEFDRFTKLLLGCQMGGLQQQ